MSSKGNQRSKLKSDSDRYQVLEDRWADSEWWDETGWNPDFGPWRQAKTLDELGELSAQFIEGTLGSHPAFIDPHVSEETVPLVDILASFNRQGFVTTSSQPGVPIKGGSGQRAYVRGFASVALADRIEALGLSTDLLVMRLPMEGKGYQVPVTITDFRVSSWYPFREENGPSDATDWDLPGCLSWEATKVVMHCAGILVVDPSWGRESYLWEQVSSALSGEYDKRFDARPRNPTPIERIFREEGWAARRWGGLKQLEQETETDDSDEEA